MGIKGFTGDINVPYRFIVIDTTDKKIKQVVRESPPLTYQFECGEDIGAYRYVYMHTNNIVKVTDGILDHSMRAIGITTETRTLGQMISVICRGRAYVYSNGPIAVGDPLIATQFGKADYYLSHRHGVGAPTYQTGAIKGLSVNTGNATQHRHTLGYATATYTPWVTPPYGRAIYAKDSIDGWRIQGVVHSTNVEPFNWSYSAYDDTPRHTHPLLNLSTFTSITTVPSVTEEILNGLKMGKAVTSCSVADTLIQVIL